MKDLSSFVKGLVAGAALMFYLDPASGRRRRALVRARVLHVHTPETDAALRERVRAKVARIVRAPVAVRVEVEQGHVRLSGQVLAREAEPLLDGVRAMIGVVAVMNALAVHDGPSGRADQRVGPADRRSA